MDFIARDNPCGQNLLRIVSRGSAIIAELLRLSSNIPEVFIANSTEQRKYAAVLFDFTYLRDPEEYEKNITNDLEVLDLDSDFNENHSEILDRFYKLFESIWKYQHDFSKYIDDIKNGYYIQHSIDSILDDSDGKQLIAEALYLYGNMLLMLEDKIPGYIREKMLVAIYRSQGGSNLLYIDEVCKLCRNTGYIPGPEGKKPKNHPETFFARFAPDEELVKLLIGRLQTDDVYHMSNCFPHPDHRSTRLAGQASILYVVLYFAPSILLKEKPTMREVTDKYFNDNWVISTYMGHVVDLTTEWAPYPAAKAALENVINPSLVKSLNDKNTRLMAAALEDLKKYLKEGVLLPDFLLDNMNPLLNTVRNCNVALRWRLLHRRSDVAAYRKTIFETVNSQSIVSLLLNTSQLEYVLKDLLRQLLDDKDRAWVSGKDAAADRMVELSEYFTGNKALTRVKKDENLMKWFSGLAEQVRSLTLDEDHATATGRKIQGLIAALEDVEQFEAVDTNIQIKSFLNEARDIFRQMIRTVNVKSEVMQLVEAVSDLSYAWEILGDYLEIFHERIRKDPSSVVLLRATFLKTASILDVPLVRIAAIDSPDAVSVAEYYSSELVEFVRRVLEVIPVSVFKVLYEIEQIQTHKMGMIPIRLEAKDLKDYAQLDLRYELAKLTHQVSVFTEGVLVMEKTLLGVIQVEPRQILEEGLRRELVRLVATAMHKDLTFTDFTREEFNRKLSKLAATLDGLKRSIEYLQDYIGIAGLKMFQEELARVINYNTEQEANRYLKKKTFDSASRYQSKAIPIPRFASSETSPGSKQESDTTGAVNFMGRVLSALLYLTDSTKTVYAPECTAWFSHSGPDQKNNATSEVCGIRTFAILERALGAIGLRGLDRLLSFRAVFEFNNFLKFYEQEVYPFRTMLDQVRDMLFPEYRVVPNASKIYGNPMKKFEKLMLPMLKFIRRIGQGQLIRRHIANILQFGCELDAHLLYQALDTFNASIMNEIRKHYRHPSKFPYPDKSNPLLYEVSLLTEACGMDDPFHKIYITSQPLEGLPVFLLLFLLTYLPKLEYDRNFGALVRKKAAYPLDGLPLVVGVACLLKQFHPIVTKKILSYLGQFSRTTIQQMFADVDMGFSSNKVVEVGLPMEVLNTLIFMEQLCRYSSVPRTTIHEFVPPFIFDSLRLPSNYVPSSSK